MTESEANYFFNKVLFLPDFSPKTAVFALFQKSFPHFSPIALIPIYIRFKILFEFHGHDYIFQEINKHQNRLPRRTLSGGCSFVSFYLCHFCKHNIPYLTYRKLSELPVTILLHCYSKSDYQSICLNDKRPDQIKVYQMPTRFIYKTVAISILNFKNEELAF